MSKENPAAAAVYRPPYTIYAPSAAVNTPASVVDLTFIHLRHKYEGSSQAQGIISHTYLGSSTQPSLGNDYQFS